MESGMKGSFGQKSLQNADFKSSFSQNPTTPYQFPLPTRLSHPHPVPCCNFLSCFPFIFSPFPIHSKMSKRYPDPSDPTSRSKRRHRNDLELTHTVEMRTTTTEVLEWVRGMTAEERGGVMTVENPWVVGIIRQMMTMKVRDGEVEFTKTVAFPAGESGRLEDYFVPVRPVTEQVSEAVTLERHLRLMDCTSYLDALTISQDLASDFQLFRHLSSVLTGDHFLKSACRLIYDSTYKQWVCEAPYWTDRTTLTLSQFALAVLEKSIWLQYYRCKKLDPRAAGETQTWPAIRPNGSDNFTVLASDWETLSPDDQFSLAGDMKSLIPLFESQADSCPLQALEIASSYESVSFLSLYKNPSEYYSSIRSQVQYYMVRASIDVIRQSISSPSREFAENLLRSPIERAGTRLDKTMRALAGKIREKTAENMARDLISETNETSLKTKNSNKRKLRKKQEIKTGKVSVNTEKMRGNEENVGKEIVENVILRVFEQISIKNIEFQVVHRRKRHEKPSKPSISPLFPPPSIKTLPKISIPPKKSPQISIIPHETVQISLPFESDVDFPPLSSENLSKGMSDFEGLISRIVGNKHLELMGLVNRLEKVVIRCFSGSFLAVYGSYSTRLALPSSDLDLVVVNSGVYREEMGEAIKELEENMRNCTYLNVIKAISTATVPVLKLKTGKEVSVDVTIDDGGHGGMATTALVTDFLRRFEGARKCVLVLKQLLVAHDLHSAYQGGLCSYSLVLWLAVFCKANYTSQCGALLLDFLSFYGRQFDPKSTSIVYGQGYLPISQTTSYCETWDPLYPANNTTKGAYRILEVLALFKRAYGYFGRLGDVQWADIDRGPLSLLELRKI